MASSHHHASSSAVRLPSAQQLTGRPISPIDPPTPSSVSSTSSNPLNVANGNGSAASANGNVRTKTGPPPVLLKPKPRRFSVNATAATLLDLPSPLPSIASPSSSSSSLNVTQQRKARSATIASSHPWSASVRDREELSSIEIDRPTTPSILQRQYLAKPSVGVSLDYALPTTPSTGTEAGGKAMGLLEEEDIRLSADGCVYLSCQVSGLNNVLAANPLSPPPAVRPSPCPPCLLVFVSSSPNSLRMPSPPSFFSSSSSGPFPPELSMPYLRLHSLYCSGPGAGCSEKSRAKGAGTIPRDGRERS